MSCVTIPMTLGAGYDVSIKKEIVYTGPLVEILTGTLETLDDTMIPETVTTLRSYQFEGNVNLTSVELQYVTEIGSNCFANCAIDYVNLPSLMVSGAQAFSYNMLETILLPELTYVASGMFQRCLGLAIADFPKATSIRRQAFYGCESLDILILRYDGVVELEDMMTFTDTRIAAGTGSIYVPADLVSSYQADTNWSTYSAQIQAISELEG